MICSYLALDDRAADSPELLGFWPTAKYKSGNQKFGARLYRLLISHWVPVVFCNEGCNQGPEQWLWILTIVLYHIGKIFVHAWRCWHLRKHFQGSSLKCYSKGNLQHFQCWFERILQGNPESCRFGSQNMIFVFLNIFLSNEDNEARVLTFFSPSCWLVIFPKNLDTIDTPLATKVGISSGAGVWRRNADSSPWGSGELWQLWAAQCIPNFDILWLHLEVSLDIFRPQKTTRAYLSVSQNRIPSCWLDKSGCACDII